MTWTVGHIMLGECIGGKCYDAEYDQVCICVGVANDEEGRWWVLVEPVDDRSTTHHLSIDDFRAQAKALKRRPALPA